MPFARRRLNVPRAGQRWGPFEVVREIARGNMGVVFQARDERGRDVALKVLLIHHDEDASARFQREARSLARLSHPTIVSIHDVGVLEGIPYLTMDYVPGTTLHDLLARSALPLSRSVVLLAQIARGVDHAHSRGVLHRDLKPANVLIGPDGAPRITDFGLARISDASASLTNEGDIVGTPVFMSPEQIQGNLAQLGPPTDVWALGVTLYLMLTGSLPFAGRTVDEVSRAVIESEPAPPGALSSDVPEDLERICMTALDKDPRRRYRTAGEMARDLEAYLRGAPVLAGEVTLGVRARRLARFARLHPGAVAGAVASVLLLCGLSFAAKVWSADRTVEAIEVLEQRRAELLRTAQEALAAAERAAAASDATAVVECAGRAAEALDAARDLRAKAARLRREEGLEGQEREGAGETGATAQGRAARGALRARVSVLRARAGLLGARGPELPPDPAAALLEAFEAEPDLAALEDLARWAARSGSVEVARRALAALERLGPLPDSPAGARRLRLLASFADLVPGARPAEYWSAHLGGEGALAEAAAELEASRRLELGDLAGASEALERASSATGPVHRLLRARLASLRGDFLTARSLLEPLARRGDALGRRARRVQAEALLVAGRPRRAEHALRSLLAERQSVEERAGARRLLALARWLQGSPGKEAGGGSAPAAGSSLFARLAAARDAALRDPGREPGLAGAPPRAVEGPRARRAREALAVAQRAGAVEAALGRVAMRLLGLRPAERARHADVVGLRACAFARPDALAGAAVLYLDRGEPGSAKALLEACPPRWLQHPGVVAARRLLTADPDATGSPFVGEPRASHLPEAQAVPGLVEAEAALAAALGRAPGDDGGRARALREGLRLAGLAVRSAPFASQPRLVRARLALLAAAESSADSRAAADARWLSLRDAAGACALTPASPTAWSLFAQALWTVEGTERLPRYQAALEPWTGEQGPSLEAHERALLPVLPELLEPGSSRLPARGGEGELSVRLLLVLAAASARRADGRRLTVELGDVAEGLAEAAAAASDRGTAVLLRAQLVLERPEALDAFLSEGFALDEELRRTVAAEIERRGPRAGAAHALRLIDDLAAASRAGPSERVVHYRRGWSDLHAIARRRPGPGWLALRAAFEVWVGGAGREDLPDLTVWPFGGALRELLVRGAEGRGVEEPATGLAGLRPLARLLARPDGR
ncbi:MAG: serine/threonine protein kinase [Planctomycetota bacterium]|nr:MAG: serine/threonine protein kinase [Planctomycetota bacterium]